MISKKKRTTISLLSLDIWFSRPTTGVAMEPRSRAPQGEKAQRREKFSLTTLTGSRSSPTYDH